ncbi:hypothetical protein AAZV13_20G025800 [Glycine max]
MEFSFPLFFFLLLPTLISAFSHESLVSLPFFLLFSSLPVHIWIVWVEHNQISDFGHNSSIRMSRRLNTIAKINDSRETWNHVEVPKPLIEMVFMDNKGHKIEAYVKSMESKNWLAQLKQGQTYIVQNFEVESNTSQYRTTNHQ